MSGPSYELEIVLVLQMVKVSAFGCNALHHLGETLNSDSCVPDSLRINSLEYTIISVSLSLPIPSAVYGARVCHHWLANVPNHYLLALCQIQKRQRIHLRLQGCCSACSSAHQMAVLPFGGTSIICRNGLPEIS